MVQCGAVLGIRDSDSSVGGAFAILRSSRHSALAESCALQLLGGAIAAARRGGRCSLAGRWPKPRRATLRVRVAGTEMVLRQGRKDPTAARGWPLWTPLTFGRQCRLSWRRHIAMLLKACAPQRGGGDEEVGDTGGSRHLLQSP